MTIVMRRILSCPHFRFDQKFADMAQRIFDADHVDSEFERQDEAALSAPPSPEFAPGCRLTTRVD